MDESDTELAIDTIFRAAHRAELNGGRGGDMYSMIVSLVLCKKELERRGWKWQPENEPSVVKSQEK